MNTGSDTGSVTAATAFAPTPSVMNATAPSLTARRAWLTVVCAEPALSRTSSLMCRLPLTALTCWAASSAPFLTKSPIHAEVLSGADTTMSASPDGVDGPLWQPASPSATTRGRARRLTPPTYRGRHGARRDRTAPRQVSHRQELVP